MSRGTLVRAKRLARRRVPIGIQERARWAWSALGDVVDGVLGRSDDLTPPRRLMFVGAGDFRAVGEEFFRLFRELGGLQPDHRVLDVGCGVGRMAVPLLGHLSERGSYDGFDVVPAAIEWCTDHITPRNPKFRFHLADVRNAKYQPAGRVEAAEFDFPFSDASFDFVFLTSVFTHMMPTEVERYVAEIARVLRPEGRCLSTWLLLNAESQRLIDNGWSPMDFPVEFGVARAYDAGVLERAVAYPETWVRTAFAAAGLAIDEPIRYGSWCGRSEYVSYQDIIVADREA